jgi:hypothetical protein
VVPDQAPAGDAQLDRTVVMTDDAVTPVPDMSPPVDAVPDATPPDAGVDKAARCADTFGSALTNAFGRADGTVLAVVRPVDQQCVMPNRDHVILQVQINGEAYRMVINVMSDRAGQDPRVQLLEMNAPLPGDPWSEGWHTGPGVALDYATTLGVSSTDFTPYEFEELVQRVNDAITLDARVSVYATSSGGASAHLVHRNQPDADGAVVLDPTSENPTWLLFHFDGQVF